MEDYKEQLALSRQKKKKAKTRIKQAEMKVKNNKVMLFGSLITKAINIEYTQIDEFLPKIIGLLECNKQYIKEQMVKVK